MTREVTWPSRRFKIMSCGPSLRSSCWAFSEARRLCRWRKSRSKASRRLSSMVQKSIFWLLEPQAASGTRRCRHSAAAWRSLRLLKLVTVRCQRSSMSTSSISRRVRTPVWVRCWWISLTTKMPRMRSMRFTLSPRTHSRPTPTGPNHRPFSRRSPSTVAKSSSTGGASSG